MGNNSSQRPTVAVVTSDYTNNGASSDDLRSFISHASQSFLGTDWEATCLTFNSDFWHLAPEGFKPIKKIMESAIEARFEEILEDIDLNSSITRFLDSLKSTQLINMAMIVVASVLQKWKLIYKLKEECSELLRNMIHIVNLLLGIESRKIEMGDSLILKLSRRSMSCIMDGFWLWYSALGASSRGKEDFYAVRKNMLKLQKQLTNCKTINKNSLKLEQVTDLLELEADTNVLAVVLRGYGGLGKTAVADAVFSNVFVESEEFLCSKVEISPNSNSLSDILKLQENILKDLRGDEVVSVRTETDGRFKIGCLLKEAAVFIYIDNIVPGIDLERLLPEDLASAKRLRLLFTTCNSDLCKILKLPRPAKVYEMESLSEKVARWYVKRNLSEKAKDMLTSKIQDLCNDCLGIQSVLDSMIALINEFEGDIATGCLERDLSWPDILRLTFIELFGLEHLEEEVKEALLDICAYFNDVRWENAKLIFRKDVLASLTSRSFVSKDESNCIKMHPVLKELSIEDLETTRITCISNPPQLSENKEADVKGIWVNSKIHIPESILDNMNVSLRILRLGSPMEKKCEECFKSLIYLECVAPLLLTAPNLRCLHMQSDASISPTPRDHFPVEFSTFRTLKILKLEQFLQLRSLPESIRVLSELQVLELHGFSILQDLGYGLSDLPALQALILRDCPDLSGEWLDYVIQLKSLRYLDIKNSTKLEERWRTIDPLCYEELFHLVVQTSEPADQLLKRISSQFPGPQEFKVDRDREAFDITKLAPESAVIFVVDCGTVPSLVWILQEIVEICDDCVQIVYIGHHLRELSPQILCRISGFSRIKSTAHRLLQLYYNKSKIRVWSSPKEKHGVFLMGCAIKTDSGNSRYISCRNIADEEARMVELVVRHSKKSLIYNCGDIFLDRELFNFKKELCYGFETKEISMGTNSGKRIILLVMLRVEGSFIDTALEESTSFQKYKRLSSISDTDYYFLYLPDPVIDEEIMEMKEWMKKNCPFIHPIEKPWSLRPEFVFFVRRLCSWSSLAVIDITADGEIVSLQTFANLTVLTKGRHMHETSSSSSSIGMAEEPRDELVCFTEEVKESSLCLADTGMAKHVGKKLLHIKDRLKGTSLQFCNEFDPY